MAGILHQIAGGRVPAKADARLYALLSGNAAGICNGCEVTASGRKLYITPGFGIIKGRSFTITDTEIDAQMSPGGTVNGRLLLQVDTSKTASTGALSFITQIDPFPDIIHEDINNTSGIYQIVLATYTANEISILSVSTEKYNMAIPHDWLYTAVLTKSGWVSDSSRSGYEYSQTVAVSSVDGGPAFSRNTITDTPMVNLTGNATDDGALLSDLAVVTNGYKMPLDGSMKFYTRGIPSNVTSLQIYMRGRTNV